MKTVLTLLTCIFLLLACNNTATESETGAIEAKKNITPTGELITKNKLQKKVAPTANNQQQKVINKKEVTESGKINWVNIEEVEQLIKQKPKKILVDAYTDWCGWCKRMDKNTFENAEIAKYVNSNFYAVKLNAETKETLKFKGKDYEFVKGKKRGHNLLAKELLKGRLSYPTISFLDEDLNLINAFPGYKSPQDFDALMNFINKNEFDKMGFTQYKASFKSNIPEPEKKLTATQNRSKAPIQKKVTLKPGETNTLNLKNAVNNKGNLKVISKTKQNNDKNKTGN